MSDLKENPAKKNVLSKYAFGITDDLVVSETKMHRGFCNLCGELKATHYRSVGTDPVIFEDDFDKSLRSSEQYDVALQISKTCDKDTMRSFQYRTPTLSSDEILEACAEYAVRHFGLNEQSAKKIKVTGVRTETVYHYILQTFGETREIHVATKFYDGMNIDGPEVGPVRDIWDIQVPVPKEHRCLETKVDVPHTERIVYCKKCDGSGHVPCERCSSGGTNICSICHTKGPELFGDEPCAMCRRSNPGTIKLNCERCEGKSTNICDHCKGHGKVISYETLIIKRKMEGDEFAKCRAELPNETISQAAATLSITEENQTLQTMSGAPNLLIADASAKLLKSHSEMFPVILHQKHILRLIPVAKVDYEWKGQSSHLVVYGQDKKVYCKEPPQKWGTCKVM